MISGRLCLSLTENLSNTSATQDYLLTLHRLIFGNNIDDVVDDVNNNLVPRVM